MKYYPLYFLSAFTRKTTGLLRSSLSFALFSTFFLYGIFAARSQEAGNCFFQHLSTSNGLSSNSVQCIFQDSRGYIWIGTQNGLNRYDGKHITVYHCDPENPAALPRESIRGITEDQDGILWLSADYGVIEFNPVTEKFCLFKHDEKNPGSLPGDHVPNLAIDSHNNLWVGSGLSLNLFNRTSRTFKPCFPLSPEMIKKKPVLAPVGTIHEDNEHNFWIGYEGGVYKFGLDNKQWSLFPYSAKKNTGLIDILIDHNNTIWSLWWDMTLAVFHPENGSYETIPGLVFPIHYLYSNMTEWKDASGVYWLVVIAEQNLVMYNHASGMSRTISLCDPSSDLVSDEFPTTLYTDRNNLLWIGTTKGMKILDNADQLFHSGEPFKIKNGNSLHSPGVIGKIYADNEVNMIAYYYGRGIGIFTSGWKFLRYLPHIPPRDSGFESSCIHDVWRDCNGVFWITTSGGLVRFDWKNNRFKKFVPPFEKTAPVQDQNTLYEITPYHATEFYIRSRHKGIYKFDTRKERFTEHLFHDEKTPSSLPVNDLRSVIRYREDSIVILTTDAGILFYNPLKKSFDKIDHDPDVKINDALHNLYFGYTLSDNILWLNSAHGLLKFDLRKKSFELFNLKNNLTNEFIISNVVDDSGNVWVTHNAGISRFDKTSRIFTNFGENNGLAFHDFTPDMIKMTDGHIYFGSGTRLVWFDPFRFGINQNIPRVHINSVKVMNELYRFQTDSVTHQKSLTLNYDQDFISIDFSVLNLSHPGQNSFYYRLDDDTNWMKVNEGIVNLVRLSPGRYILHVTGSNDSGLMNSTGDELYLRILPPFYETWWFRMIILALFLVVIYFVQRVKIGTIRREEQMKTEFSRQLAQAETRALRAQMNPHFIFNSLNSINSFIIDKQHEIASEYLIKFSKLIRLILDNSRSETISLEKELETLKLYVILESARYDDKFRCIYTIADNVDIKSVMIPPMLLQPFVENAIWHGLMQKEGNGTIAIDITMSNEPLAKSHDQLLKITITDDGIGREKSAELKSKSAAHKSHGLKVTSQRIEMMNKLNITGARVDVTDLKDSRGNATGTQVMLLIPV